MGTMCTSCARREDEMSHNCKDSAPATTRHQRVIEFLGNNQTTKNNSKAKLSLQKAGKFDIIMDSTCNYWLNENSSLFGGSHRTAITYRVENIAQLVRIENSIITEDEYRAARKIKDLYFQYKRRKELSASKDNPAKVDPADISSQLEVPKDDQAPLTR